MLQIGSSPMLEFVLQGTAMPPTLLEAISWQCTVVTLFYNLVFYIPVLVHYGCLSVGPHKPYLHGLLSPFPPHCSSHSSLPCQLCIFHTLSVRHCLHRTSVPCVLGQHADT